MFLPSSRYAGLVLVSWTDPNGNSISYVSRRFLPTADEFDLLQLHTVIAGERLDNITAEYLDDPQQFWRICDANEAMSPSDLTATAGQTIRITLPQGIPGNKKSILQSTLLPVGYFDPMITRVILVCTLGGIPNVLIDGVITRHEVAVHNEAGMSTLTITGEDLTVLMDVVQLPLIRYPCMPIVARL